MLLPAGVYVPTQQYDEECAERRQLAARVEEMEAEAEAVGARGVGEGQRLGLGVRLGWAAGPLLHTVALGVASALPVSEAKGAAVVS